MLAQSQILIYYYRLHCIMNKQNMQKQTEKKSIGKLTTSEEDKGLLFQKLKANDLEGLRKINIKQLDLNIFQPIQNMEFVDQQVSPLMYCAFYGKTDLAKLLFENKLIDCDLQSPHNRHSPLSVACLGSNYEMVKLLIDKGAEVNKPNLFFQTPLIVILMRLIEQYQSFQQNRICLRIAQLLIIHGADPNWVFQKQKGYNLLHFLCSSTIKMNKSQKQLNYDLIKLLINHGANVNQKTLGDKRAIDLLEKHCNAEAVRNLLMISQQKHKLKSVIKPKDSSMISVNSKSISTDRSQIGHNTVSKGEQSNYSRDQQVQWYKNNLLSIHGIRREQ